jgi:DNA-binding GntR family transcriptional regulator
MNMNVGLPAYEQIRDILREEIISGKIPSGTKLKKAEIAERFGVSPMPVREALQWLKGEGLISGLPHRGYKVILIDEDFIRNTFEIRTAMEELLSRNSVSQFTDTDIMNLSAINEKLISLGNYEQIQEITSLDKLFHNTLYQYSSNPIATDIYEKYRALINTLRKTSGFSRKRFTEMTVQHSEIIGAIKNRNEDKLEKLIRVHKYGAMIDLLKQYKIQKTH